MDKEHIKRLADNPNFIPGIHNYCDRWCERCPFTTRCMNFALSEETFPDPESRDIKNEVFWQKLAKTFHATLDLLKEMADQQGIDLESLDTERAGEEDRRREDNARDHKISRAANAYGERVNEWFDASGDLFQNKEDELNQKLRLGIPNSDAGEEAIALEDAVQVIHWYQYQIHVKLMRAIEGDLEEELEILADLPKDSDGSAKVALIGIDRSIGTWSELRKYLPEQEDKILDILVHLERLRRGVEKEFPNARAFVRPGFDEIPYDG